MCFDELAPVKQQIGGDQDGDDAESDALPSCNVCHAIQERRRYIVEYPFEHLLSVVVQVCLRRTQLDVAM